MSMHKELLVLGLAGDFGPISGYDMHRIIQAHGELFRDLKKPNMYHLLTSLARRGYLRARIEPNACGRSGEKKIYSLTAEGRRRFQSLLEQAFRGYDPSYTGMEVAVVFLSQVSRRDAIRFLRERQDAVDKRRTQLDAALARARERGPLTRIAADHLLGQVDAERVWLDRSLRSLSGKRERGRPR